MKRSREETSLLARQRWRAFISLSWYEALITFVFSFVAKTSEVLLAMGLVVSTTSFLTNGAVMGTNTGLATAWAWAQAIAIDSSLGITFASAFLSCKQRDWIKGGCYGLLAGLLALVAGTITNVDTFSHAIHLSIAQAILRVGLDVRLLTTLRAIAVVGFLLLSRLQGVSFKELATPPPTQSTTGAEGDEYRLAKDQLQAFIQDTVASLLAADARHEPTIIVEEQQSVPFSLAQNLDEHTEPPGDAVAPVQSQRAANQQESDDAWREYHAKLARAYQELRQEGKRISGRTLARRAHVRRTTCNRWLALHHPKAYAEVPK